MQKKEISLAQSEFSSKLLRWNKEENGRKMPWKGEKDPYKIWISEIILQQTRVDQGLAYYERFIQHFPTIQKLAAAPEAAVFKLWEGLGYYSRCRNLIHTAKLIDSAFQGRFPDTYDGIRALKGVGPYTAAAISSFAFDLPYAVVDGNVFRVLARVFGIHKAIDSTEGKNYFSALAQDLLDKKNPAAYNQAIMDFGATICKPAAPLCKECVFNKNCKAYKNGEIDILPIKEKKISIRKRWFYYLVMEQNGKLLIRQRTTKDIWQQLYEFPMVEHAVAQDTAQVLTTAEQQGLLPKGKYSLGAVSILYKQQLSHQLIAGQFIRVVLKSKVKAAAGDEWVSLEEMKKFSFPVFINQYLSSAGTQALF